MRTNHPRDGKGAGAAGRRLRAAIAGDGAPAAADLRRRVPGAGAEVVGLAGSLAQALALVERLRPDLLLLEARLLAGLGPAAGATVKALAGQVALVVAGTPPRPADVAQAIALGAPACVAGEITGERLQCAVDAARQGLILLDEGALASLWAGLAGDPVARYWQLAPALTPRECLVLRLLAQGLTYAEIARRLGMAPVTARSHVCRLLRKLGLPDRPSAIRWARRHGLGG